MPNLPGSAFRIASTYRERFRIRFLHPAIFVVRAGTCLKYSTNWISIPRLRHRYCVLRQTLGMRILEIRRRLRKAT